jgi:hypothetical protein
MWSKLVDSGVGIVANDYYDTNHCAYHNWNHILDCYKYLEQNSVPYDEALDFTVMHHDIVYDALPQKEARSSEFLIKHYPSQINAVDPIMATETHRIRNCGTRSRWMIRADLHQLADPKKSIKNYSLIADESMKLYNINFVTFSSNNLNYMKQLKASVFDNYSVDLDPFWLSVAKGIDITMDLSSSVIKHS